jgi:hypothetical protein
MTSTTVSVPGYSGQAYNGSLHFSLLPFIEQERRAGEPMSRAEWGLVVARDERTTEGNGRGSQQGREDFACPGKASR